MADTPVRNPFEDEKPKIVHLEKDQSHYEYCRMQMHDIDNIHKRTFFCNLGICILVCFLAVFRVYVACFSVLSAPFKDPGSASAILTNGIFQILVGMIIMVIGYLAWANFRSLNFFMTGWYLIVTVVGVVKLDYVSAVIGIVGVVVYFFSLKAMSHEAELAELDGYPDFQEKFDISKSDIVIATLMAHKGEHRTKSTLFTTDYSLRRKKKRHAPPLPGMEEKEDEPGRAGEELAMELRKHLDEARDAQSARTAIATLDAVSAAREREEAAEEIEAAKKAAEKAASAPEAPEAEPETVISEPETEKSAPEPAKPEPETAKPAPETTESDPDDTGAVPAKAQSAAPEKKPAQPRPQGQGGGKKKKKKRH